MKIESTYLCLSIRNFTVQSVLRQQRGDLFHKPFAIYDSLSQLQAIVAVNDLASSKGIIIGMSKVQASLIDDLILFPYSEPELLANTSSILTVCRQYTPFIEDWSTRNHCVLVLDVSGTEKLFTTFQQLAYKLASALSSIGFSCKMAVSHNLYTALLLATSLQAASYIQVSAGQEQRCLARLTLIDLPLSIDQRNTFINWGLNTVHDISALSLTDLVSRMGAQAIPIHQMACGCRPHNFTPMYRPSILKEIFTYDLPVELMDSLLFTISLMLKQLISRVEAELSSIAAVLLTIHLDDHSTYSRLIRTGKPTLSHRLLLKLIQLELESSPPGYCAVGLELTAETGRPSKLQAGLFSPQLPEPSQLELTVARIRSIVGSNNAGSPVLENSHQPVIFRVESFVVSRTPHDTSVKPPHILSLRRLSTSISMKLSGTDLPRSFTYKSTNYDIKRVYGPWVSSGSWWNEEVWCQQQWDVIALSAKTPTLLFCCISCNANHTRWVLEGIYD